MLVHFLTPNRRMNLFYTTYTLGIARLPTPNRFSFGGESITIGYSNLHDFGYTVEGNEETVHSFLYTIGAIPLTSGDK